MSVTALCAAALAAASSSAAAAMPTTWLCRPGLANNPCTPSLTTTQISPTGAILGTTSPKRDANPAFDCFYVYPTVSDQQTLTATLRVDPEQRSVALYQAARYSQHCRVYAPVYRQLTTRGILSPDATQAQRDRAYRDVRDAWRSYLKHDNKGRGVVFVGHSQGTFVLRQLIREEVDPKPKERARMISALLLGGNVLVRKGKDVGGDFKKIRACHSAKQLHCVIAFSTFNETPPDPTVFGAPSAIGAGGKATAGLEVLCTNPAALGGGSAKIDSLLPSAPFAPTSTLGILIPTIGFPAPKVSTAWIEADGAYTARCSRANKANVLLISGNDGAPTLKFSPTAGWGLHLVDGNIALGDLVDVVARQGKAYIEDARKSRPQLSSSAGLTVRAASAPSG